VTRRRLPGSGRLLQLLAFGHAAVGIAVYRDELRAISRDGIVAGIPYHGPKATAFWFLAPSPPMWLVGRLLGGAEEAGDAEALRTVSRVGLVCAAIAALCMPLSGFWGWLAISLRGLVHARRMGRR
jgi:Family of unknown function (DUF6463)